MNRKQKQQRLRLLALKAEFQQFVMAVLESRTPASVVLHAFAAKGKLKQFLFHKLFSESYFQEQLYRILVTLQLGELDGLRRQPDVCNIVFPGNERAFLILIRQPHRETLFTFFSPPKKTAFYLGTSSLSYFFTAFGKASLTPQELDSFPDDFWVFIHTQPTLRAALHSFSPTLVSVAEHRALTSKHALTVDSIDTADAL